MLSVFALTTDPGYEANTKYETVSWCGGGYGDFRSYCRRNCTSYVAYKLAVAGVSSSHYMHNGNGYERYSRAKAKGIPTGSVAKVGAVGYWTTGDYGHVAWVDSVNADGSANTSNYNGYTGEFYKDYAVEAEGYIYFSNVTELSGKSLVFSSDVDGNGASDLVLTTNEPTGGTASLVALSTYQGFLTPKKWWRSSTFGWSGVTPLVGDVTGDKIADYVFLTNEGVNGTKAWVAKSTKTGFSTPQLWWNGKGYGYSGIKATLGDVDGNGASDLVLTTNEPTGGTASLVALSTYQGFLAPKKWWSSSTFGWSGVTPLVGDVTGDKIADYVFLTNEGVNGTKAWVAKSTKTGFSTPQLWWNGKGYGYSGIKAVLR